MVFNSTEHKRMSIFYMWLIFYGITAALNLTICLVFSHNSYYFNDSCYVWSLLTPFIYTFYPIVIIFNMLGINFEDNFRRNPEIYGMGSNLRYHHLCFLPDK